MSIIALIMSTPITDPQLLAWEIEAGCQLLRIEMAMLSTTTGPQIRELLADRATVYAAATLLIIQHPDDALRIGSSGGLAAIVEHVRLNYMFMQ
jgi:hypothetical protein